MSKSALARRAGISRQTLALIERDEGHEASGAVISALGDALDDPALFWWEKAESETHSPEAVAV